MSKVKGYILAVISAASYGLIPLFVLPVKQAGISLDTTLFYRFFIAAVFVFAILLYRKESLKINWNGLWVFVVLGLFYGLSSDLLFKGYDLLTPGIASTILFVYPAIIALILFIFFKEKINNRMITALLITFTGVYVLSVNGFSFQINLPGLMITLGSALFYALYLITVNKTKIQVSGWKLTFYSLLFTSVYYLLKMIFQRENILLHDFQTLFNFTLFALITTVISLSALVYAVQLIGSTPTAVLGAFEPVVAVLVSVLIFNEAITKNLVFGVILILLGVIISILAGRKK
ncbi:MAG: DMT family transporter [Weeksellaceae bacterium]